MTRLALHILFFLSGAAALGYQLSWSKMFSTGLGHEYPAVLAIVCAFMIGMALGSWLLDRFTARDARAGRWLVALEFIIGVWAMLAAVFIPHVNELALRLMGINPGAFKQWAIAFTLPMLTLLPATIAIGATFPAMEKFYSGVFAEQTSIGGIYAANTFGAVTGTLFTPFVLMPALGLRGSGFVLGTVSISVSAGILVLARRTAGVNVRSKAKSAAEAGVAVPISFQRISVTLFVTGVLGIAYETTGVRVLSQVLENTVFSYAAVLAVFLFGTAAGAAAFHRWWRHRQLRRILASLLYATAAGCLLGILALAHSAAIYRFARGLNDTPSFVVVAQLLTASAVFALPTFFMGATFSHLVQLACIARGKIGGGVALNTLGAALAPILIVLFLPLAGAKWTLIVITFGYAIATLPISPSPIVMLLFLPMLLPATLSDLRIVDRSPGERVTDYREGAMGTVAVVEDADRQRTLRVDNRFQMGGTAAAEAQYRQTHLPMLLHTGPRRALFLGVGTGISFGAASLYPGLKSDGVELVPEVARVMSAFAPANFEPRDQPNLRLHIADARRFVRATRDTYDVIVADVFHPYRDGAGALYTVEHFRAVRERLNTNGLFCQWLPLHQIDDVTLRLIVRSFLAVFPDAEAWMLRFNVDVPVIGLIGGIGNQSWTENWFGERVTDPRLATELKRLALAEPVRLFGHLIADADDLHQFAGSARLNTDDHQQVSFTAARAAYRRGDKPYASLLSLLASAKTQRLRELHLARPGQEEFAVRVSKYISARNVFLRGLMHDAEGRHEEALAAYVESARLSPDFTSGYAQALSIATTLASSDSAKAKRILEQLAAAQPERTVARDLLQRMFTQ